MDELTADTLANRDEPIPVLPTEGGEGEARPTASKDRFSVTYLKEKFRDIAGESAEGSDDVVGLSLQDRLLTKLLEQVIPAEENALHEELLGSGRGAASRPAFSLPAMTNNFRRFNARIGIVFTFQNHIIKLLSWNRPTQTWSFLFIYSFVCLDPYLLLVVPLVVLLVFIMVPAFLTRHPAPPPTASTSSTTPYYSYEGPALAPAKTIKPVPETSRDFFRNMRDLQNSMADFAILHDTVVASVAPITNFSNEILSSTAFLAVTAITATLFLTAHLLPWRLIFMLGGDAAIIAAHPAVDSFFKEFVQVEGEKGAQASGDKSRKETNDINILGYSLPRSRSSIIELLDSVSAISLDSSPEEREVEIFELQHKVWSPYSASSEWEPFLFAPTPYDPLSPSRIAGDRPKGTRFFEDVRPPRGWAWKSKKWELDLDCAEWVMERMVTGVEFEVPSNNHDSIGEEVGGWVWDLPFQPPDESVRGEATELPPADMMDEASGSKSKSEGVGQSSKSDWEETTKQTDRIGEWRRRRWVRVVNRVRVA